MLQKPENPVDFIMKYLPTKYPDQVEAPALRLITPARF